jgi:hypothetical protein
VPCRLVGQEVVALLRKVGSDLGRCTVPRLHLLQAGPIRLRRWSGGCCCGRGLGLDSGVSRQQLGCAMNLIHHGTVIVIDTNIYCASDWRVPLCVDVARAAAIYNVRR